MEISGFGVLMAVFAILVLLIGMYMFTGHKIGLFSLHPAFKNLTKDGWRKIGKWTMVVSFFIYALAIVGFIFNF